LEFDLPFDSSAVMSAMSGLQGEVKGFGTSGYHYHMISLSMS
jgi:hypothetical protein